MKVSADSWSVIQFLGQNAEAFLQGQLTCDMTKITEQAPSFGALCNHQGRVLAVPFIFKIEQTFCCLVNIEIKDCFQDHLKKFAPFSKVIIEDHSADEHCLGSAILQLQKIGIVLSDVSCIHALKNIFIDRGIAIIYPETIGAFTPHMLNLPAIGAVSFAKGCYVGQEIIARTQYLGKSKRHLVKITTNQPTAFLPGDILDADGQEIGAVVDSIVANGQLHGLAVIQDNALNQTISRQGVMITILDSNFTPAPHPLAEEG